MLCTCSLPHQGAAYAHTVLWLNACMVGGADAETLVCLHEDLYVACHAAGDSMRHNELHKSQTAGHFAAHKHAAPSMTAWYK